MFQAPHPPPPPPESLGVINGMHPGQPLQQPTQGSAPAIISAFPDPPSQYVSLFTDDNVTKGLLPDPPKPIIEGQYSLFGTVITCDDSIIRPLEAQGIRRLYPRDFDHKKELKKMNHSILVNFLDLLDILVKCPDTNKREEKATDINMLFIQMHHLINELRPHQARETVRVTLVMQKRERLTTTIQMKNQVAKVTEAISNHLTQIPDSIFELKSQIQDDILRLQQLCLEDKKEQNGLEGNKDSKKRKREPLEEMEEIDARLCSQLDEEMDCL